MKKFLMLLCAVMLVFFVTSSSYAVLYTDTVDVGSLYGADSDGRIWQGDDAPMYYKWDFTTPSEFEVPYDIVNSAMVDVEVGWVDTFGNDYFFAYSNPFVFTELDQNTATYDLDIASLFVSWDSGDILHCGLLISELLVDGDTWNGDIILGDSTFRLDYDNGTAPVPEPSTILLLGAGLLGLAGYNRKRFNKKN